MNKLSKLFFSKHSKLISFVTNLVIVFLSFILLFDSYYSTLYNNFSLRNIFLLGMLLLAIIYFIKPSKILWSILYSCNFGILVVSFLDIILFVGKTDKGFKDIVFFEYKIDKALFFLIFLIINILIFNLNPDKNRYKVLKYLLIVSVFPVIIGVTWAISISMSFCFLC